MNCAELNEMLDRLMDGELTGEQLEAMEAHGRECPECAEAIRSARQLKALFEQEEPEVDVPLQAQAAWRKAVREEARRQRNRRLTRWVASAAAAVVVLVGVGVSMSLRGAPSRDAIGAVPVIENKKAESEQDEASVSAAGNDTAGEAGEAFKTALPIGDGDDAVSFELDEALLSEGADADRTAAAEADGAAEAASEAMEEAGEYEASEGAVVETDGFAAEVPAFIPGLSNDMSNARESAANEIGATGAQRAPALELALSVEDASTACDRICDVAMEYEGTADVQKLLDGGANVFVQIDAGNAGDFLNAIAPMDVSGQEWDLSGLPDSGEVQLLLTING